MNSDNGHMTEKVGNVRHSYRRIESQYHPTAKAAAELPVIMQAWAELPDEERAFLLRISEQLRLRVPGLGLGEASLAELVYKIGRLLAQSSESEL